MKIITSYVCDENVLIYETTQSWKNFLSSLNNKIDSATLLESGNCLFNLLLWWSHANLQIFCETSDKVCQQSNKFSVCTKAFVEMDICTENTSPTNIWQWHQGIIVWKFNIRTHRCRLEIVDRFWSACMWERNSIRMLERKREDYFVMKGEQMSGYVGSWCLLRQTCLWVM